MSVVPDEEKQDRLLFLSSQPLGSPTELSPTELNTPSPDLLSTLSSSPPPIRTTIFSRPEKDKLAGLEHQLRQLRGARDDAVRDLLIRTGYGHLLAKPDVVDSDLSYASEKASFTKTGMKECHSIEDCVEAKVKREVKRQLQPHVKKIVDENSRLLYDLLGEHEREFCNEFDDRKADLRSATEGYINEIEESMGQLEAKSIRCLNRIQDQVVAYKEEKMAKFKLNRTRRRQVYGLRLASCKRLYPRRGYTRRLRG